MYENIKNFIKKHKYIAVILIVLFIIAVCMFCSRKDVYNNTEPINDIRNELNQVETTKQDIAGTVKELQNASTDLANSIKNATNASTEFDAILDECTSIIEQIRNPTR